MNYSKWINIVGLILDIIGAMIMWKFTPAQQQQLFLSEKSEIPEIKKQDKVKDRFINWGMIILGLGFALQLIAALGE